MLDGRTRLESPVVILDRSAGLETGHHRHWFELLVAAIDPGLPLVVIRSADALGAAQGHARDIEFRTVPDCENRSAWYGAALEDALSLRPRLLLLLSGDDALSAVMRASSRLRTAGTEVRSLMFRLSPQPHRGGRMVFAMKLATVGLARWWLPNARFYMLELPVGRRPHVGRWLDLQRITDSSAAEQQRGVGYAAARLRSGLPAVSGPVVLTIGMLGAGKHVDTLLEAWRLAPLPDGLLLFAGQADEETDQALAEASRTMTGVEYRPGRLSDADFDLLLEAADIVCAVYRYSASSGVVLRALALGSKVLAGGSAFLEYTLAGVPGVTLVHEPAPSSVAMGLAQALAQERPVPAVYRDIEREFPTPLVASIEGAPHHRHGRRDAVLLQCRKTGAPQEAVIHDAEAAFMRAGLTVVGDGRSQRVIDDAGRAAGRLRLARPLTRRGSLKIVCLLGPAERQLMPHALSGRTAWYVWDCWPTAADRWRSIFNRWRPQHVFFATRDAADHWRDKLPWASVHWSPEAVEPGVYEAGPDLAGRPVAVLEMGRRHPTFHRNAVDHLSTRGARHVHSTPSQPFVFPDRASLVSGLHRSVASVCYPGTWTDPGGRTGPWESMTHRYLEAAATRTLIIGHLPSEMVDLFGFRPGIEVDPADVHDVLDQIVDDPARFQPLVDRTHARLLDVATWDVRVKQILRSIEVGRDR